MKTQQLASELNSFFDRIFVISVAETEERNQSLNDRLGGLQFEKFKGVDGRKIFQHASHPMQFPKEYFKDFSVDRERFIHLSGGQLGCSLSHQGIYKKVINERIETTLVLEDDVALDIDCRKVGTFKKSISSLPDNWDVLYLGYEQIVKNQNSSILRPIVKLYHHLKRNKVYNLPFGECPAEFYPKKTSTLLQGGVFFGTWAYAISLQGAEKLLAKTIPLTYLADELLMEGSYYKWLNAYALKTPILNPSGIYPSST